MATKKKPKSVNKLRVQYLKATNFMSSVGTGIIGGFAPNGYLNMSIYVERLPIADDQYIQFDDAGNMENINISKESKDKPDIVREISHTVLLDPPTAKAVRDWLDRHLTLWESHSKEVKKTK